ncbi:MAG: twin-arginine translocase TatA/TatE family subunit [Pedobacter sp.]
MNIGGPEMILIFLVVLLLFGGKKLPELARGLGKGLREFKDASDGIKREIHNNINAVNEVADQAKAEIESATGYLDTESPSHTDNSNYSNPDEAVLEHGYASLDQTALENDVNTQTESMAHHIEDPAAENTGTSEESGVDQTKQAH